MKKLLNNPWIVGALVVGALVVLGDAVRQGQRSAFEPSGDASGASSEVEGESDGGGTGVLLSPRAVVLSMGIEPKLRDPFLRPRKAVVTEVEGEEPAAGELVHLSGIWQQAERTYVLLNGRVVAPGDRVGSVAIDSAELDGVWLSHDQGRDFLRLGSTLVVNPTTTPRDRGMTLAPHAH